MGFSIGYTPSERERLADVLMSKFKDVYGRYPASAGCWILDAHMLGYLHDRYGVTAACVCKDQWGTDGYTLWGGYWNQAYYPSRKNAFMPAQHAAAQIPVPVFRMLGSDPIYQYSAGLYDGENCTEVPSQGVVSLEPAYHQGGGDPAWVRWFFDANFNAPCLGFAYTQVGQENSFGWPTMAEGLCDQMELLAQMRKDGRLRVETLAQSADWFRQTFPLTPATAVTALNDWKGEGHKSVWYDSRFYRANLFWEGGSFAFRDIHVFGENYAERYLTEVCPSSASTYDTLPLADGLLWSGAGVAMGLRPMTSGPDGQAVPLRGGEPKVAEKGESLEVRWPLDGGAELTILCRPDGMEFAGPQTPWRLELVWTAKAKAPFLGVEGGLLRCRHEGFDYAIACPQGRMELDLAARRLVIVPQNGRIAWSCVEG